MQVLLVDPSKGPQIGAERRTRPLAGMTVDLASAITIVIARPFMHAVAACRMRRMTATIAGPFISVEYRATTRDICRDQIVACVFGRVVADPKTALARVPRDNADDGGRSLAKVPCPFRLLARRRGGSSGSGWGVLFSPRVLVQLGGLKGRAGHHARRRSGVQVGLDALP
jgi:hypothetical protein